MSLPALDRETIARMDAGRRWDYFCKYARHIPDSRTAPYAIRIGSTTLTESDTYALRMKFEAEMKRIRRKLGIRLTAEVKR